MIIFQIILYLFLFTGMVAFAVRGKAVNALFMEVMNWYDGIVIDKLWVGHSKFRILPGTEDIPFVQTWKQVPKKRGFLTLIWIVGSAIVGGLLVLIF